MNIGSPKKTAKTRFDSIWGFSADCIVKKEIYTTSGRICLQLIDEHNGEDVATATVNIQGEPLDDGEVMIKDYSENEGIRVSLERDGIIGPVKRSFNSGWVTITIHDCLIKEDA